LAVSRAVVLDEQSGSVFVPAGEIEIARRLAADIEAFVESVPDYRGPGGVTARELVAQQSALVRSIAAAEALADKEGAAAPKGRVQPLQGDEATFFEHYATFFTAWEEKGREAACEDADAALKVKPAPAFAALVERRCGTGR
jgi:hypothetical protein